MPEMDGFEATKRIRSMKSKRKLTPVIAMTAHAMEKDREKCLKGGMDGYISKPIKSEKLYEVIERFAAKNRLKDNSIDNSFSIFNKEKVLKNIGGDTKLLKEITEMFLQNYKKWLKSVHKAIDAKDSNSLLKEAHSLKGALSNIGADEASNIAYNLEMVGKEDRMTNAKGSFAKLEKAVMNLVKIIQKEVNW